MAQSATKRCRKCRAVRPLSEFHRLTSAPDGRQYTCKQCRADAAKTTRPAARKRQAKYREANREELRAKGREYWARPENRGRARERYEANRDEVLAQQQARYQARKVTDLEGIREQRRAWYVAHREQVLAAVRERGDELRRQVYGHYGAVCACCGRADNLSIDHVNGDGREHREEIFGRQGGGVEFYYWLVTTGFPDGFQTLCRSCNQSKGRGRRCRLAH